MIQFAPFLLVGLFFLAFSSCKKKKTTDCTLPETVSFSQDIQPLFNDHCISCHGGGSPSGNLNLESSVSYLNLLDPQSGYLDTINPSSSLLYSSMNSTSNPMPPNGKLDNCKIELVLKWIQQKAKNN